MARLKQSATVLAVWCMPQLKKYRNVLGVQVVASVSAEQQAEPVQKGPLGLSLNHSDVFR